MLNINVKQYDELRSTISQINDCTTKYIGFVLGGSGIGLFSVAFIKSGETLSIGYSALALSSIVTLVLHFIFYKINSHNRANGYCKLLSVEYFKNQLKDNLINQNILLFESCVEELYKCEINPDQNLSKIKSVTPLTSYEENKYNSHYPEKSPLRLTDAQKGFKLLVKSIFAREYSASWRFPVWIMIIFTTISFIYFVLVLTVIFKLFFYDITNGTETTSSPAIFITVVSVFTIFQLYYWNYFFAKFHTVMRSDETIDSYFWKFLIVRRYFLKSYYDVDAKYKGT